MRSRYCIVETDYIQTRYQSFLFLIGKPKIVKLVIQLAKEKFCFSIEHCIEITMMRIYIKQCTG